jgi:phosphoribosylformylglycinamidine synthase II
MNQVLFAIKTRDENTMLLFWVDYAGAEIKTQDLKSLSALVSDEVDQDFWIQPNKNTWNSVGAKKIEIVRFRTGVTDNPAHSFRELLSFHEAFKGRDFSVHSGEATFLKNTDEHVSFNPLIQERVELSDITQQNFFAPKAHLAQVEHIKLHGLSREALESLSQNRFWALSGDEMIVIQKHYGTRDASDIEMEVLAQTWSEHCKHKIFAANIAYEEAGVKTKIPGLFKTYIQKPTFDFQEKKDWAISVFKDNAGIVRFHEKVDVCIKVETHNSPSALDPYGGALTGILGVNRDILGTGLGARPIANTNVLLFGDPDEREALPKGLFHPSEILKGVHKGIQDGGNKSGIPTVNGAMIFDESFSGKPLVFCGTVGVLPREINGVPSASKNQRAGDLIVMVGGAVGLDGIHGATSSSLALDSTTPSTMVQIGDPLTQKRVMDFLLEARDLGLYNSLTDNGAGGLSSSIGEMAAETGGARVELDHVPLKYPGLLPWQIFVSESQERMTFSVPKENWEALSRLSKSRGVESTVVGEFTSSGYLDLRFHGETVGKLDLKFLHDGLPKMELEAVWSGPRKNISWKQNQRSLKKFTGAKDALIALAKDPSLASKEKWVRQYDHEVQGATVVKPFEGAKNSAPNDGGVVWMGAHGNPGFSGVVVSSGICPEMSEIDPKIMALIAADEAVRNAIVTGADPDKIALIDNFCWPDPLPGPKNPDAKQKLAELVRTCQGLESLVRAYGMPLVSGKDSMKNDFIGKTPDGREVKISVLPTLLVTALAYHPDVRNVLKPHAQAGSVLYLLGSENARAKNNASADDYFGTTLPKYFEVSSSPALEFDLIKTRKLYGVFHEACKSRLIETAHDVSEGGILFAVFEKLMLNNAGITFDAKINVLSYLSEEPGRILVTVKPENLAAFERAFSNDSIKLGVINDSGQIKLTSETISVSELALLWRNSV